jgi:hypothetical protein
MAFPKNTISLAGAQSVFQGVEFTEIKLAGSVVGYRANFNGSTYEHKNLRDLCRDLWQRSASVSFGIAPAQASDNLLTPLTSPQISSNLLEPISEAAVESSELCSEVLNA